MIASSSCVYTCHLIWIQFNHDAKAVWSNSQYSKRWISSAAVKQKFLNPDYHQFHISGLVTRRFTFGSGIWTITLPCSRRRSSTWGCPRLPWSTRPSPSSRWVPDQWPVTPGAGDRRHSPPPPRPAVAGRLLPSISSDTHSNVSFATHNCHWCDSSNGACLSRIWCSSLYEGRAPDGSPSYSHFIS